MANGALSSVPTSMIWPSPPRNSPGPPESWRYSLRQTMTGDTASLTSIGTFLTPLGKAVADSPSLPGRAPVPPAWKLMTLKGMAFTVSDGSPPVEPGPPSANRFHRHDVPSAGTLPPSAWCRQPNITSGSIWPVTWRAATGAGFWALRIESTGAVTRITDSEPSLFGTLGATMHFTPNEA